MTKLLVPIDESELSLAALPTARWLAEGLGASIVLLSVGIVAETSEQAKEEREHLMKTVDRAVPQLGDVEVKEMICLGGDPVETILRTAREEAADMIVMSTHGRSPLGELAQGSVAESVMRRGAVPVTLVRPREADNEE